MTPKVAYSLKGNMIFRMLVFSFFGYFATLILATHILPFLLILTVNLVFICFFLSILCVWLTISHQFLVKIILLKVSLVETAVVSSF